MSGLGKGLDDIFNIDDINDDLETIKNIDLENIIVGESQPRIEFNELALEELRDSIIENGILQPIIVVKNGDNYEIVAGERRFRAAKMAKLETIPAIVRDYTKIQKAKLSLIENLQREELNPVEQSKALKTLKDEFNLTQEEIANSIGKSRSYVTNQLRLLNLPDIVLEGISNNFISVGHAKELLSIKDNERILKFYNRIISHKLSVRGLESLIKSNNVTKTREKDIYIKDLEKRLTDKLGRKVLIKNNKLEIYYYDKDDFDEVLNLFD